MRHKKGPVSAGTLTRATSKSVAGQEILTKKLSKYARLKGFNCQIGAVLGNVFLRYDLQEKLDGCGRFLSFRQYLDTGKLSLLSGNYCNKHLLCPCCSAARSRRLLARWLPVVFNPRFEDRTRHYLLTLTWPPPQVSDSDAAGATSLKQNLAVGLEAWGKLWGRRRKKLQGPFADVLGAILAVEVTSGNGAGWHPHFHILLTCPRNKRVDANELRAEWTKLTGGRQLRIDVLRSQLDLVEAFKYAVKPVDVDASGVVDTKGVMDRYRIYTALQGARLIRGVGCYHGVKEEDLDTPETVDDFGSWVDLVFEWTGHSYQLVQEIAGGNEAQCV